jgi:hypothetical protein
LITKVTDTNQPLVDRMIAALGETASVTIPWSDVIAERHAHRPF